MVSQDASVTCIETEAQKDDGEMLLSKPGHEASAAALAVPINTKTNGEENKNANVSFPASLCVLRIICHILLESRTRELSTFRAIRRTEENKHHEILLLALEVYPHRHQLPEENPDSFFRECLLEVYQPAASAEIADFQDTYLRNNVKL